MKRHKQAKPSLQPLVVKRSCPNLKGDMKRFNVRIGFSSPLLFGAGTVLDISGAGTMRPLKFGSMKRDRRALAGDCQAVGSDFDTVLSKCSAS